MSGDTLLYLSSTDVRRACEEIDPLACVQEALLLHASGDVVLPAEAYLGWDAPGGGRARSLSLPGWLGGDVQAAGTKIINANPENVARGLPRASGLTIVFEPHSARPACVMDAAHLSSLRTAALTVVAARRLCARTAVVAVLGAGVLADAHVRLLGARLDGVREVRLFDLASERTTRLIGRLEAAQTQRGIAMAAATTAREAVSGADLVVTCTTTVTSYIPYGWLAAGCVAVNVSLDDLDEDVFLRAARLYVDDWRLVVADDHRLLGRLARAGRVTGPGEPDRGARAVTGTLGQLLAGTCPGRGDEHEVIVVNPFGMAVHDVAMANQVYRIARQRGLGVALPR